MKFDRYPGKTYAWALDFIRAISNRPLIMRILFWLILGESGRHEFWGLVWAFQRCGDDVYGFECEWRSDMSKMPLFWRDKRPHNPKDADHENRD